MKIKNVRWTKNSTFTLLYIIGFLGAGIIGFFSTSYFAYEEFNSLVADIFYLIFLSLVFVAALVQDLMSDKSITDKIISVFVFGGGFVLFLLLFILGGVTNLIAIIYSAIFCMILVCQCVLTMRKGQKVKPNIKQFVCIGFLMLAPAIRLLLTEFVKETYFLWALIPAGVISCTLIPIGFVLLHKVWRQFYPKESSSIGNAIAVIFAVIIISFFYSFSTIGIINCVFDNSPTPTEYTVLEKHVNSGASTPTQFEVKVEIDGEEKWINLPVIDYHAISEGDTVIVDYYKGALGFGFYTYNSIG